MGRSVHGDSAYHLLFRPPHHPKGDGMFELIDCTENPVGLIAACARVSHNSFAVSSPQNNARLVSKLIELGHLSSLEFARATFYVSPNGFRQVREEVVEIMADSHGWAASLDRGAVYLTLNARTIYELLQRRSDLVGDMVSLLPGPWKALLEGNPEPAPVVDGNVYLMDAYKPPVPARFLPRHSYVTVHFRRISRIAANQIVRHRIASYMQESQRYCYATKNGVKVPPSINNSHHTGTFFAAVAYAEKAYTRLIEAGVPKEDARFIYPLGAKTNLVASMSLEMWKHFIELRTSPSAQWEIRKLAEGLREVIVQKMGVTLS